MPTKSKRRVTLALALAYFPIALAYLAFSGQLGAADWRTRVARTGRTRAGSGHDARSRGAGVLGARRELARLVRRAHLDRREATRTRTANSRCTKSWAGGSSAPAPRVVTRNRPADGYWYGNQARSCWRTSADPVSTQIIERIEAAVTTTRTPTATTSGPGRTPTRSPRSSCAACPNCAWICRPRPSARTISAGSRSARRPQRHRRPGQLCSASSACRRASKKESR